MSSLKWGPASVATTGTSCSDTAASLVTLAKRALYAKWAGESQKEAMQAKQSVQALIESIKQTLASERDAMLQELYASEEAQEVVSLRAKLKQAEERFAAKASTTADRLDTYQNTVQSNFDKQCEVHVEDALRQREELVRVQEIELEQVKRVGVGVDDNARICRVCMCTKVQYVPMHKRCVFVGDDGACAGALASCGCSTKRCVKCRASICDAHFAQHKRMCMLCSLQEPGFNHIAMKCLAL